jgi:taspase (threonine aspartase 1)
MAVPDAGTAAIEAIHEGVVCVHIGAGQHSEARTKDYLDICALACARAIEILRAGGSAVDAASAATVVLEDAGETNAGFGSNLVNKGRTLSIVRVSRTLLRLQTESGTVEMDAGIMDGSTLLFGAVGAMPGIRNPVKVARLLVNEQEKGLLPLGRVPPGLLVGEGARNWAVRHGFESIPQEKLISEKSNKLFRHYKKKLDAYLERVNGEEVTEEDENAPNNRQETATSESRRMRAAGAMQEDDSVNDSVGEGVEEAHVSKAKRIRVDGADDAIEEVDDHVTDTVGAVVMDVQGRIAAAVSSGGIALKQPGRVGQAAVFGCGCWAQNSTPPHGLAVGVTTTGCGEHLIRTALAKECASDLANSRMPISALQSVMKEKFVESKFLVGVPEKLGGALCLHYDRESDLGEFLWTHTTSSMGVAFQRTSDAKAMTKMSRLPKTGPGEKSSQTTILVEAMPFTTLRPSEPRGKASPPENNVALVTVASPKA